MKDKVTPWQRGTPRVGMKMNWARVADLYFYKATITRVMDGDTFVADIDLGVHVHVTKRLRLFGFDAPERREEKGKEAKARAIELLEGKEVMVRTHLDRRDKYGRLLAEVWIPWRKGRSISVGELLLKEGLARPMG